MSLSTAQISADSTAITATGGTSVSFTSLGDSLNQMDVFFDGTTIVDRKTATFKTKFPVANASSPDGYTQARNTVVLRYPILLADGETYTTCTLKIELASSVEMTTAEMSDLRYMGAQILGDTDFDDYFNSQAIG